jgi:hypothetical protein
MSADLLVDQGAAFSKPGVEGVVVHLEAGKQNLMLLFGDRPLNE